MTIWAGCRATPFFERLCPRVTLRSDKLERKTDAAWPRPVWGVAPAVRYGDNAMKTLIGALRRKLDLT